MNRKWNIFYIRLTVIVVIAYMLFFQPDLIKYQYWAYAYVALFLLSNIIIFRLPDRFYSGKNFYYFLVFFDTGMIALGIFLSNQADMFFYLIYFFIIAIAAMSMNFKYMMLNITMFIFVYGFIMYNEGKFSGDMASLYALRLPFIFAVTLMFGYTMTRIFHELQKSIQDRDDKYFSLVESINSPVYMVDRNGRYLSVNDTLATEVKTAKEKLIGKYFSDFHRFNENRLFMKNVNQVFSTGNSVMFETYNPDQDKWTLRTMSPFKDREKEFVQAVSVVSKDTTERVKAEQKLRQAYEQLRQTQEQLIQKNKMEAVGRLSAGIAHQMRNPLEIILMGLDFLEKNIKDSGKTVGLSLEKIKKAVYRADRIVEDFLQFSKTTRFQLDPVDICPILREALDMVEHRARKMEIRTALNCPFSELRVMADKTTLQQVFINLMNNGLEAMQPGGILEVKVLNGRGEVDLQKRRDLKDNEQDFVIVQVIDQGQGIPREEMSQVFEPFYTSKGEVNGTGLGLSIANMIIERHGGKIEIESEEGQGSTFSIYVKKA
ncbi:MAG: PAS domain-containing protein [Desulfohalobiaceae bacterium]|nr:PAS domain-containing protein [Desulfohalobiaceae bacterium]